MTMTIPKKIQSIYEQSICLYTNEQIQVALDKMATEIHGVLAEKNPLILCVMIGGMVPLGNLLPRLDFPLEVDYVHASRYRGKTFGTELIWHVKPHTDLRGRTVLVVDDILDGGITLKAILDYCSQQGAAEVLSAVLVDKQHKRVPGGLDNADFVGLNVDDHYIFGFGMDYQGYLRNTPGIYQVPDSLK